MNNVKIGDSVRLTAPSGNSRVVVVTDVIREFFSRDVMALEFDGVDGPTTLSVKFFSPA